VPHRRATEISALAYHLVKRAAAALSSNSVAPRVPSPGI